MNAVWLDLQWLYVCLDAFMKITIPFCTFTSVCLQRITMDTGMCDTYASVPSRVRLDRPKAGGARSAAETSGWRWKCATATTKTDATGQQRQRPTGQHFWQCFSCRWFSSKDFTWSDQMAKRDKSSKGTCTEDWLRLLRCRRSTNSPPLTLWIFITAVGVHGQINSWQSSYFSNHLRLYSLLYFFCSHCVDACN